MTKISTLVVIFLSTILFLFLTSVANVSSDPQPIPDSSKAPIEMSPKWIPQSETRVTLVFTGVKPNGCYMVKDFADSWDGIFAQQQDEYLCGISKIIGSVPDGGGNKKKEAYIRAGSNGVLTLKDICDDMSSRHGSCSDTFDAIRGGSNTGEDYKVELFEISLNANNDVTGSKKVGQGFYSFFVMYSRCAFELTSNAAKGGELIDIKMTQDGDYNVYLREWDENLFLNDGGLNTVKSNGYKGVTKGVPIKFFLPDTLKVGSDYLISVRTSTLSRCNPLQGTIITITGVVPLDQQPPSDQIPNDDTILDDSRKGSFGTPDYKDPTSPAREAVVSILDFTFGIAGGVAFLLMIFGAYRLIFAAGNPEAVQHGKEIITAAIAGLIVIIFAVFILRFLGFTILGLGGL